MDNNNIVATTRQTVAFQGVAGSFSSMAARALCGCDFTPINSNHFREIFQCVIEGSANIGVVPIENAVAGSVHENFDLLEEYPCSIIAEVYIPVQLHLLVLHLDRTISKVYSHPKALEQCSRYLEQHPEIQAVMWSDTAGAAKHVALMRDPSAAAIASEEAASIHGLAISGRSIQNHPTNATRFIAISKHPSTEPHPTKCSLIVSLPHKPGSLHTILGEIAKLQLNITKLESRPILGSPFSYSFHIDIEGGDGQSQALREAAERITQSAESTKILGFYRHSR